MAVPIKLKRTLTPNLAPPSLQEGELAAGLGNDPIKLWIGTTAGVKELPFGGGGIISSPTEPVSPSSNQLWFNSTNGKLYLWFDDGNSEQWIALTIGGTAGPPGPIGLQGIQGIQGIQGERGLTGEVEEAPEDGTAYLRKDAGWIANEVGEAPEDGTAYLRRDGAWIPMTASDLQPAGYMRFPNGFLWQWGRRQAGASDFYVTFPVPFNTVFQVLATVMMPSVATIAAANVYTAFVFNLSNAGCTIAVRFSNATTFAIGTGDQISWLAIGI